MEWIIFKGGQKMDSVRWFQVSGVVRSGEDKQPSEEIYIKSEWRTLKAISAVSHSRIMRSLFDAKISTHSSGYFSAEIHCAKITLRSSSHSYINDSSTCPERLVSKLRVLGFFSSLNIPIQFHLIAIIFAFFSPQSRWSIIGKKMEIYCSNFCHYLIIPASIQIQTPSTDGNIPRKQFREGAISEDVTYPFVNYG